MTPTTPQPTAIRHRTRFDEGSAQASKPVSETELRSAPNELGARFGIRLASPRLLQVTMNPADLSAPWVTR